jgi:hypothetical protein
MYISELKYNLKPGVNPSEVQRVWEEKGLPTYQRIPGLLSMATFQYTERWDHSAPEWQYVWVEVWESKEALANAHKNKLFSGAREWFRIFRDEMAEKGMGHHAIQLSSYQNG